MDEALIAILKKLCEAPAAGAWQGELGEWTCAYCDACIGEYDHVSRDAGGAIDQLAEPQPVTPDMIPHEPTCPIRIARQVLNDMNAAK